MSRAADGRFPSLPDDASPAERLIAHRGLPARHPELSAAGLAAARDAGAPMVEIDVRPTADGLMVVLHDPSPRRITGGTEPDAAQLDARSLTALHHRDDPRAHLLLLDEALALLAGRTAIDIEVKPTAGVPPDELAGRTIAALVRAGSPLDAILTSEDPAILVAARRRAPRLTTGFVFRSRDRRDPVRIARQAGAAVIVANRRRVRRALIDGAHAAGLSVWAYVAPDAATCRALLGRGCERVFVDDYPRLARELGAEPDASAALRDAGPRVLVLDLGSSSIRASLVRPGGTILAMVREPTPGGAPEDGASAEHDAAAVAEQAARQIARLAHASDGPAPVAAAIASQRSTGLWVGADGRPVGPAVSWRDGRGAGIVTRLESRAAEFERITGLPLDAAWTAVTARATLGDTPPPPGWRLVPLGSHVASRLTGEPPDVDPTLANRTFLLDAEAIDWSPVMLEAFGFETSHLPPIAPTVCPRGRVPWPGAPQGVPLLVLVGDQQAAYVGIAGPAGRRLALNVGTAGFAMRGRPRGTPRLPGIRRAPLWTSERHRLPPAVLDEIPVPLPDDFRRGPADDAARALARAVAFGEKAPADWVAALGTALTTLREVRDASVRVAGGWANAPHLVSLLRSTLDLSVIVHEQPEATTVGAARLACAGAGLAWPGG